MMEATEQTVTLHLNRRRKKYMFETDLDAVLFSGASEDVNFLDFLADEQLCGGSDEVVAKGLGHERERPTDGCTHGINFSSQSAALQKSVASGYELRDKARQIQKCDKDGSSPSKESSGL